MSGLWTPPNLADHDNGREVTAVLASVCRMTPEHLADLALLFHDSRERRQARDMALGSSVASSATSLTAFAGLLDVLHASLDLLPRVPSVMWAVAVADQESVVQQAIVDAFAGSWARGSLPVPAYQMLIDPWIFVFSRLELDECDESPFEA